jgi:hypothetical protein
VVCANNSSTQEAEARRLKIQEQLGMDREFQDSLGFETMSPKKKKNLHMKG